METIRKRYLHDIVHECAYGQGEVDNPYRLPYATLITASGFVPGLANVLPRPLMRVDCDALLESIKSSWHREECLRRLGLVVARSMVPVGQRDDSGRCKQVSKRAYNQLVGRTIVVVVQRCVRIVRIVNDERPPESIAVLSA
jgi:hypothetical protein